MFRFDHVALACEELGSGTRVIEERLGVALAAGGQHEHFGTHNRLLSLGGEEYLEVIAIDPAATPPLRTRWFDLDRFSGRVRPTNWILRCDNLEQALEQVGPAAGVPVALARGKYSWRMAVPESGRLPMDNLHPALIQWEGPHPAPALPDSGCRLRTLTVRHPDVTTLERCLGLDDPRIRFEPGAPGLLVELDTPKGVRVLG